jgi:hypothetical protein
VADGGLQSNTAAQGIAKDVGIFEPDVFDQGGNIVRHLLEGERAINIGGVSMSLQLDGNDLPVLGKDWQKLLEHPDYAQAAVKENQRLPFTVNLVAQLESVYVRVFAL